MLGGGLHPPNKTIEQRYLLMEKMTLIKSATQCKRRANVNKPINGSRLLLA